MVLCCVIVTMLMQLSCMRDSYLVKISDSVSIGDQWVEFRPDTPLKADKDLTDLSNMFNSKIIGWINYYGKFYKSEMYSTLRHINKALIMWARKKYKKLARHKKKAEHFLGRIAKQNPKLFKHWEIGIKPTAE